MRNRASEASSLGFAVDPVAERRAIGVLQRGLPARPLVGVKLSAPDDDVRSLHINGRSRMYAAVRAAAELSRGDDDDHAGDGQQESDRERDLYLRGERETLDEDQDRAARAAEHGSHYED